MSPVVFQRTDEGADFSDRFDIAKTTIRCRGKKYSTFDLVLLLIDSSVQVHHYSQNVKYVFIMSTTELLGLIFVYNKGTRISLNKMW